MSKNKKLTLEEIHPNMFVRNIFNGKRDLIFFIQNKGKNDEKELYGWSIHELEKEPAKLLVQSSHWKSFRYGDSDYLRLLTPRENKKVRETLLRKIPDSIGKMEKILKTL
ncbi:MAG: hypothetical protein NT085_03760 [candidate division SR1 bacterium]|nr:hypothetical protein [candidate division SR1 bacterium]